MFMSFIPGYGAQGFCLYAIVTAEGSSILPSPSIKSSPPGTRKAAVNFSSMGKVETKQ